MVTKRKNSSQERLEKVSQALEFARKMQHDWMTHGLDFVNLYVEDWSEDWLEKWGEDEEEQESNSPAAEVVATSKTLVYDPVVESISAFLEGNDPVALQVRKQLKEHSPRQIAIELKKCLSLPAENNQRLFAVKTILADSVSPVGYSHASTNEDEQVNLLELAEKLLEKLLQI